MTRDLDALSTEISEIRKNAGLLEECSSDIVESTNIISHRIYQGSKILLCGNGGSSAIAQHFVAELVVKFEKIRAALPAIALGVDWVTSSASANDFCFESVFSRQISAVGRKGDVLCIFSTSGTSKNIIAAAKTAKNMGIIVIAIIGQNLNELQEYADHIISVNSNRVSRIQECHLNVVHIMCGMLESEIISAAVD